MPNDRIAFALRMGPAMSETSPIADFSAINGELWRCACRCQPTSVAMLMALYRLYGDGAPFQIVHAELQRHGLRLSQPTVRSGIIALIAGNFILEHEPGQFPQRYRIGLAHHG